MDERDKKLGYAIIAFLMVFTCSLFGYLYYLFYYGQYDLVVQFPNLGILSVDDAVKIRGKQVGRVKIIERRDTSAYVTLEMWATVHLKSDYQINERDRGLMGDREIEMYPGNAETPINMKQPVPGTFIPGIAENMSKANNLRRKIGEFQDMIHVFAAGNAQKKSFAAQFRELVDMLDRLSIKLEAAVNDLYVPATKGIAQVGRLSHETRTVSKNALAGAGKLLADLDKVMLQLDKLIATVNPAMDTVGVVTEKMLTGSSPVAQMLRPASFADTLQMNIRDLRAAIEEIEHGRLNINLF